MWCIASILSGFPALRVGSYVFGGSVFPAVFFFGDLRIFPPFFSANFPAISPAIFVGAFADFKAFLWFFIAAFSWKSFKLCKAIWLSFFPLVFNGFSFGAKFVVSDFLLCIGIVLKNRKVYTCYILHFLIFLSSFVNLTVITSDFSYVIFFPFSCLGQTLSLFPLTHFLKASPGLTVND